MGSNTDQIQYTPVRITTIKAQRVVNFPVFIHFKDHYLEYLAPNNSIEVDKYKKLRKQKITKFYIRSSDENKYQQFLDDFLSEKLNSTDVSVNEKSEIVTGQAESAIDRMVEDPKSESGYNMTRKASKNLQKLIYESPEALGTIFGNTDNDNPIIQHCINVAVLTIKFAKKQKFSDIDIDYLCTAALMHDIALVEDEELNVFFSKTKSELEPKERNKYHEHTKTIIPILEDRPYINQEVIALIQAHEENLQGLGPNKMKKLSPAQECLSMINSYDKLIYTKNITPKEAIKIMIIDEMGNYSLDMLNTFKAFLKEEGLIG